MKRCPIDEFMVEKLKNLLQQQIDGVLERIDEDEGFSFDEDLEGKGQEGMRDDFDGQMEGGDP